MTGLFANHFQIGQNEVEIIIDFGQFYQDDEQPAYHTRIITNPVYAKDLLKLLNQALTEYERQHGPLENNDS